MRGFNKNNTNHNSSEQRPNLRQLIEEQKSPHKEQFDFQQLIESHSILSRIKKPNEANANSIFNRIKTKHDDQIDFNSQKLEHSNERSINKQQPLVIKLDKQRDMRVIQSKPYEEKLVITRKVTASSNPELPPLVQKAIREVEKQADQQTTTEIYEVEVTNLPQDATEENIKRFFLSFGRVKEVMYNKSLAKAIIQFTSKEGQGKAISLANGKQLGANIITVQYKKFMTPAVGAVKKNAEDGTACNLSQQMRENEGEMRKPKVVEITLENQKTVFMDENGVKGSWFAVFENGKHCKECRRYAPEIHQLADSIPSNIKVAHINCKVTNELCKILGVKQQPQMIYFHQNKGYIYEGEVTAKRIQKTFLSNNRYQSAKIFADNVKKTVTENLLSLGPEGLNTQSPLTPFYLFMEFHCGHFIGFVFYTLGRDHWKKETKIIVFTILAFGPIFVFIYKFFRDMFCPKQKKPIVANASKQKSK